MGWFRVAMIAGFALAAAMLLPWGERLARAADAGVGHGGKSWASADQSCAASNCHGGSQPNATGRGGHEATVWQTNDPHARAFAALKSDLAQRMMAILAQHDARWPRDATKEVRCLACHASPTAAQPTEAKHFGDDGVSCRSCHGEASKWLETHYDPDLKLGLAKLDDNAEQRQAKYQHAALTGLKFLGKPELRAATCVGCHVGAKAGGAEGLPRREVDHELIAAGHPRLAFDLASQSDREPRHWRDRPQLDAPAEWAAGQAAALHALADLAASREGGPRLDFADQACLRCHLSLPGGQTRQLAEGETLGKLGWAAPYKPAVNWLANGDRLTKSLAAVEQATPATLLSTLQALAAVAKEPAALDPAKLPKTDGLPPSDRDALLAEYRARYALDPKAPRTAELAAALKALGANLNRP